MEPETISFDENIHSSGQQTHDPQKNVWAAVLIQAIDDLNVKSIPQESEKSQNDKEYLKNQANAYFKSKRMSMGSFVWICELFDIDPDVARKAILNGNGKHEVGLL